MGLSDRIDEIEQLRLRTLRQDGETHTLANGHGTERKTGGEQSAEPWPKPGPLPGGLLPVRPLVDKMIPEPFRPWLTDIAERIQCPIEFPVIGAVVAAAAVVGRRIGIRPKRYDDWLVVPNLWGAAIGRPGIMKSPALAEAMRPLQRLVAEARKKHEENLKNFQANLMILSAQKEALQREVKEAIKQGKAESLITERVKAQLSEYEKQDKEPVLVRYVVNDSTVEKLGELLNQNPNGLLLFRDELTGWLRTLDRDGHENDRSFYLETWNGAGEYTYDRIGRGTLFIKSICVSLLGGIQPGPLASYIRGAVRGSGNDDDGLVPRIQLAVYPDDPGPWRNVDRWPNAEAKNRAFTIFQQLDSLDPLTIGAKVPEEGGIPFLRLTPDAQKFFDQWRTDLENKIRSREEHPALEAHLSKYRSLMPSLALLFHLLDVVDTKSTGPVSGKAAELAAAWCDFLELHARRIYQGVTQHSLLAARQLAERIQEGKLPDPFTPHGVYHNGWTGLSTAEDVEQAAEVLEDLNWLRSERIPSGQRGGRPRFHYHINPGLKQFGKEKPA